MLRRPSGADPHCGHTQRQVAPVRPNETTPTPTPTRRCSYLAGCYFLTACIFCVAIAAMGASFCLLLVPPFPNQASETPPLICSPHPEHCSVYLPEECNMTLSHDDTMTVDKYPLPFCSNQLCLGSEVHCREDTRCCCRSYYEMAYEMSQTCPNYFEGAPIVMKDVPEDCVCMPCDEIEVVMFIQVLNRFNEPIQLANVTTKNGTYLTDSDGVAGFPLHARVHSCEVEISAVGYQTIREKSYHVIPGEINVAFVTLFELMSVTVNPPASSFMISMSTLKITGFSNVSNSEEFAELERPPSELQAECFVFFPAGIFDPNELYTFLMSPFDMRETDNLEFRAHKSFVTSHDLPIFAAAMGSLEIIDSNGLPFHFPSNAMLAISLTLQQTNFSLFEIDQLQLFSQKAGSKYNLLSDIPHIHTLKGPSDNNNNYRVAFQFPTSSEFQLSFIIGLADEACQIKVFAFDTMGMWDRDGELTTDVMVTATLHQKAAMYVNIDQSDGCILIPCQGQLTVELIDRRKYNFNTLEMDIGQELTSGSGQIYFSRQDCEGLSTQIISKRQIDTEFISFTLINETFPPLIPLPPTLPISQNITYCSIRIGVAICSEDDFEIRASSEEGVIQVEHLTGAHHGLDGGQGSGGYFCNQIQYVCFVFVCGSKMMVEVRKESDDPTERQYCIPTTTLINADLNRRKRQQITFLASEGFAFELQPGNEGVCDFLGMPYVARQKCYVLEDQGTVVDFQCDGLAV